MFDKAAILARLQKGEAIEDIANELADALNEADTEYRAKEAKRLEEAKALEAKRAEEDRVYEAKREAVCEIIDGFCDFVVAAGDDDMLDELQNVDIDKMVRMFDEMLALAKSFANIKTLEFPVMDTKSSNAVWNAMFNSLMS